MRKVLSFVLVLSLVLGSFSMAFAADTTVSSLSDIDGIANEEAIQVNYDLGIVTGNPDGTFLPAKAVTRAEFAAMVTRALAIPDSALAGYTATSFKDTAGYSWAVPYLAFCQSKGIMLGDGNGNAMPGRTINTNEAVTMAMRAIGYTANSAQLVGAWPSNYVTLAQNSDLYDDVANVVNVDKANAAQIIYNLLTVEKVAVNSDGETTGLNTNLLTSGLGCTEDAAAVIRGTEDSNINLKPYVGAYAVTYSKSGDVVAVGEVKSDFLTGEYEGTVVGDENLDVDGTDYSFDKIVLETTPTGVTIVNGYATASAGGALLAYDEADVTMAVDVNGKTIKKIYSVAVWNVTNAEVIDAAGLKALADDELLGEDFALNDDDELDLNSFELVGVSSLDKIAADDVVYVYTNGNTDKIAKVAVGTEVVTGKVTEVDGTKFVIGGKSYKLASDAGVTALGNITPVQAGWTITAQLDAYGYVYDYEKDDADADTYGVVKFWQAAGIDNTKVKLYTSADATTTIEVDDDVVASPFTAPIVNELVGYALDSDGVIETLDTTATATSGATVVTLNSISVVNVGGTTKAIAKDVVVFTYNATDGFDVTTIDKVKDDADLNANDMFQYITNSDGYIVAMVIDSAAAGKTSDDSYGVVNKVTGTVDADDDAIQRIQGFANGAALDKNTTKNNVVVDNINGASPILYKVEFDADGLITKVTSKAAIAAANGVTVNAINSERTAIQTTSGGVWVPLADGVVVYEIADIGTSDMTYSLSGVNSMRAANNYKFWAYDTDTDEAGAEVVIFVKY